MFAKRLTISLLVLATALTGHSQDSLLLRNYRFVKQQSPWLTSRNAAGLTRYRSVSIAEAEASLSHAKGGLADFYESPSVVQANARIESFRRISQRTVVFGSMSYDNYSGRDMTGSAFMQTTPHPDTGWKGVQRLLPFDLVEDSLTNPGRKHRDTYQLNGAVGIDIGRGASVGLRLDYTAANYAKYKDLRHKNKLMDLTLTTGITVPVGSLLRLGANYYYRRTTESVTFSTYGKSEKVYKTLINYGPYIGRVEQFGNSGYTDKSREMPLVDDYNGGALQAELTLTSRLSLFSDFTYACRNGYYGRKSPYTITFSRHHSKVYNYHGRLTLRSNTSLHLLDVSLAAENLENLAETYQELANDAGAYHYEYYEPVKTANKLWQEGTISYTANLNVKGDANGACHERTLPLWVLTAAFYWAQRRQTAYLYPYYRRQDLTIREVTVSATHHVPVRQGLWAFTLHGAFQEGSGAPYEDLTFATPSDKQEPPAAMDAFLCRHYQYLTAPQYTVGGSIQYAFLLPGTQVRTHARLSVSHRKANGISGAADLGHDATTGNGLTGRDRLLATVTLGCTF